MKRSIRTYIYVLLLLEKNAESFVAPEVALCNELRRSPRFITICATRVSRGVKGKNNEDRGETVYRSLRKFVSILSVRSYKAERVSLLWRSKEGGVAI